MNPRKKLKAALLIAWPIASIWITFFIHREVIPPFRGEWWNTPVALTSFIIGLTQFVAWQNAMWSVFMSGKFDDDHLQ